MDLMNRYINQRRFVAFVEGFLKEEYERRKQEAEKENEMKLWIAYVHSYSDKTYDEWKKQIFQTGSTTHSGKSDADLTEDGIKSILDSLFTDPKTAE
jgi:hypothetical protein